MILTIGHSNHPIERFLALLKQHGVETLADVRSVPFSRFNPQFNRKPLEAALAAEGIHYLFLGEELGARSTDPTCYDGDRVNYAKLAATASFRRGIERVSSESQSRRVALMCAEREPLDCHRTILVTRELERAHVPVAHILADGMLEPHERTRERLLELQKLPSDDLFADHESLINAAYDARAAQIAYVRPSGHARR
jgi:uncharacterized protein (DUF488 family)